jgi:SAM-dependent methyltransferase
MTPEELLSKINLLDANELIVELKTNTTKVGFCFLKAIPSLEGNIFFQKMISCLARKQFSENEILTDEIQMLYTHLAFYFKKANKKEFADSCCTFIANNIFKKRLSAWLHYKRYNNNQSHITEFSNYLQKLSLAIYDDSEDYTYEILSDLNDYKIYSISRLPEGLKIKLLDLFNDIELQTQFPILLQLQLEPIKILPDVEIAEINDKVQVPSPVIQNIFDINFLNIMKKENLFGYTIIEVTSKIIQKGQADFDQGYEDLTAQQVVKLYCYCNMRMHYFTSLNFYERSEFFEMFYNSTGRIKFIDIGCGPGTSGLAFANYIFEKTKIPAVFDYFGIDTSLNMQNQAKEMMKNQIFTSNYIPYFVRSINNIEINSLANSSCIILNASYVFASEDLSIDEIVTFINDLRKIHRYTPKYLLFQNPANKISNIELNKRYTEFKKLLGNYEEIYIKKCERICYYNQIKMYGEPKFRDVYLEILKL